MSAKRSDGGSKPAYTEATTLVELELPEVDARTHALILAERESIASEELAVPMARATTLPGARPLGRNGTLSGREDRPARKAQGRNGTLPGVRKLGRNGTVVEEPDDPIPAKQRDPFSELDTADLPPLRALGADDDSLPPPPEPLEVEILSPMSSIDTVPGAEPMPAEQFARPGTRAAPQKRAPAKNPSSERITRLALIGIAIIVVSAMLTAGARHLSDVTDSAVASKVHPPAAEPEAVTR